MDAVSMDAVSTDAVTTDAVPRDDVAMDLVAHWPLFGLNISTPNLELRPPSDDDLPGLLAAIGRGIHDPEFMPFYFPWTDAAPPELERNALQYYWRSRAEFSPQQWDLTFAVFLDGHIIGTQNLVGRNFDVVRQAETGSWLSLDFQGKGYGKEMRRAVLHFAFTQLGAQAITSGAYVDNPASSGVSLAVGYEPNGSTLVTRRDGADEQLRFRITKARWEATRTDLPIEVSGFRGCEPLFGL